MASSFWKVCGFAIHTRMGGLRFLDFFTLTPVFKRLRFQALHFQDPCGSLAKMMQYMYVFSKEHFCADGLSVQIKKNEAKYNPG